MDSNDIREAAFDMYASKSFGDHLAAVRLFSKIQQRKLGSNKTQSVNQVDVSVDARLPQLSWVCVIQEGKYHFTVGSGVETGATFIVEGVWDTQFGKGEFHRTNYFYGSGAVLGKYVIFVPPKHCFEYLYVLHDRHEKKSYVSNSFAFIFAMASIETSDELFAHVERRLNESTNAATNVGIDLYDPRIVQTARHSFYRMMFYNFVVDAAGSFRLLHIEPESTFDSYVSYRSFIETKLAQVFANGLDAKRKGAMSPTTTISRGYDSICISILARAAGCKEALTIRAEVKDKEDSGLTIGNRLGLKTTEFLHIFGHKVPDLRVSFESELKGVLFEFVATAGIGDDVVFSSFEEKLARRILLMGAMGDSVWRRNSTLPPGLPVRVIYGKSITEFRLRVGFAFVPVPTIGARFPTPVKRINRSPEMAPYTLWAPYDRPFPRRVIEEAGFSRGTFAVFKAAVSPTPTNFRSLFRPALEAVMARYQL
jgi:hypothetical protein